MSTATSAQFMKDEVPCGTVVCYNCSFPSCEENLANDYTCQHLPCQPMKVVSLPPGLIFLY